MPKIFVDDFNNGVKTSPSSVDIYPVDYDYCIDYIMENVEMNRDKYYWSYFCYSCRDKIEDMSEMSDFEVTVLSCGHMHHTACLLSKDTYNMNAFVYKCTYCNSNHALDVIRKSLEKTYYACILAYDMKNPDYISEISNFSQKCHTQGKSKAKKNTDSEKVNIKMKVKEERSKPVLRRSARLIEKNKTI